MRNGGVLMLAEHPVFPILLSTDMAASRAFYHDTLGLEMLRRPRSGWSCGAEAEHAGDLAKHRSAPRTRKPRWRGACRTCDEAIADLRARGVHIEEYDGARSGDGRWHRRHGPLLGGMVHRPEPERVVGRPAQGLSVREPTPAPQESGASAHHSPLHARCGHPTACRPGRRAGPADRTRSPELPVDLRDRPLLV